MNCQCVNAQWALQGHFDFRIFWINSLSKIHNFCPVNWTLFLIRLRYRKNWRNLIKLAKFDSRQSTLNCYQIEYLSSIYGLLLKEEYTHTTNSFDEITKIVWLKYNNNCTIKMLPLSGNNLLIFWPNACSNKTFQTSMFALVCPCFQQQQQFAIKQKQNNYLFKALITWQNQLSRLGRQIHEKIFLDFLCCTTAIDFYSIHDD